MHVEGRATERSAHDGLRASPRLIQTNVGHIGVGDHAYVIGALEHRAVHGTEACRRTELVIALIDVRRQRQQPSAGPVRAAVGVPGEFADLERLTGASVPRDEIRVLQRPPAPRDVVSRLEVLRHQGTAPPCPVPGRPAECANPHSAQIPRVDARHAALGEGLCRLVAFPAAALEQQDRQARAAQIQRDRHARGPSAGNADVCLECRAFSERPGVDQHELGSATAF